ncbi:UDP-2,4-diacetamido-2,4,6-trideoxy-beta-L-altropyranose hydrolase [Sphingomonas sp. Root241]|uniref:UDP-2,4-diacetamido-2,4, 6-trideoxy-beta-L-altropyranose hydrolase n=1 Tax=Sphingomonas sp. Root241 TaxID=1736501 RepID=UPI001F42E94B|nr:UDP-2,4-diacetamido-2,4,6-trideoxy-beta-L-altropyranose hydrolase [Sphingomonas sp. Root241]
MRCLTLADALREDGGRATFLCREHPGHLGEMVRRRGHSLVMLPPEPGFAWAETPVHSRWLGASGKRDAAQSIAALGGALPDWLIVDHYALEREWEETLRPYCRRLMIIDDLADRTHDCDLLLDQNLVHDASSYRSLVPAQCRLLLGPEFALLRPQFAATRARAPARPPTSVATRWLISLGGVDKDDVTSRVLRCLREMPLPAETRIDVVMGASAPWTAEVRAVAAEMPWPTHVLADVSDMAGLMEQCDLAIGAAGATSWERCCLGLPAVTLVLAENQREGARMLEAADAVISIDDLARLTTDLPRAVMQLMQPAVASRMRRSCAAITDGLGTARVVQALTAG